MSNLNLWNSVSHPAPINLKEFGRTGGFKGTAVNPMWMTEQATQAFGPMGIGWGLEILDEQILKGSPIKDGCDTLIHVLRVKLWYILDGKRGEIVQFGQTTFVGGNKYGAFTDEEAPKKSLTDGMSKCLSLLGFGAAIFQGRWDGCKYTDQPTLPGKTNGGQADHTREKQKSNKPKTTKPWEAMTGNQRFLCAQEQINKAGGDTVQLTKLAEHLAVASPRLSKQDEQFCYELISKTNESPELVDLLAKLITKLDEPNGGGNEQE